LALYRLSYPGLAPLYRSAHTGSTTRPQNPCTPTASPPPPRPTPPSPFRRLLPLGIDEFFDVPFEWRSQRRRPTKLFLQTKPAFGATGDMLFDSEHFSLGEFLQGVPLQQFDCKVGHGIHDSRFWRPRREGPAMLHRRSNRLKTWRQSHVDRLQIGRQRRVGLPVWSEYGSATPPLSALSALPALRRHRAHRRPCRPHLRRICHQRRLPFRRQVDSCKTEPSPGSDGARF